MRFIGQSTPPPNYSWYAPPTNYDYVETHPSNYRLRCYLSFCDSNK